MPPDATTSYRDLTVHAWHPKEAAGRGQSPVRCSATITGVLRIALFDLDNTLVDRQTAFGRWAASFASRRGMDGDAVAWLRAADHDGFATRHDLFSRARRHFGLDQPVTELIAEYRAGYFEFFEPDPTVLAVLQMLRDAGWRIGVVTNGPGTQHEKIRRAGLAPLLDGCCISDELGMEKPDRRIFDEAVRRCAGEDGGHGTVWMIGDTPIADIAGGRAAGLRTAWLHRGREWTEQGFRPDIVASNLRDAAERIMGDDRVTDDRVTDDRVTDDRDRKERE